MYFLWFFLPLKYCTSLFNLQILWKQMFFVFVLHIEQHLITQSSVCYQLVFTWTLNVQSWSRRVIFCYCLFIWWIQHKKKTRTHTPITREEKKNTNKNGVMTKKHTEFCCLCVFTNDLAKLYEQVIHTHEKTVHWTFS